MLRQDAAQRQESLNPSPHQASKLPNVLSKPPLVFVETDSQVRIADRFTEQTQQFGVGLNAALHQRRMDPLAIGKQQGVPNVEEERFDFGMHTFRGPEDLPTEFLLYCPGIIGKACPADSHAQKG